MKRAWIAIALITVSCSDSRRAMVSKVDADDAVASTSARADPSTASADASEPHENAASATPPALNDAGAARPGIEAPPPLAASDAAVESKDTPSPGEPASQPSEDSAAPASDAPAMAARDAFEWPADCEERHIFSAHGKSTAGDSSKYRVPAGEQWVAVFYFKSPWSGDMQLLKTRGVIDNSKILHHWTLLVTRTDESLDGVIRAQADTRPELLGGEMPLMSGGPGGTDLKLPPDIGMRMTGGNNLVFELEVHYFNGTGEHDEEDASGVEVCVTGKKRPIEAAIHTLGRNSFSLPAHRKTDVVSTCLPQGQSGPIHLMAVAPHMHLTGVRAKLVLNRESREVITLHDAPYDFLEQRAFNLPGDGSAPDVIMNPGDSLTSTCSYNNTRDQAISQGQSSQAEMCEMAMLAWPAGALHNELSSLVALLPGKEGFGDVICMDP